MTIHQRLGAFYFFYFASIGIFMPYWPPYLEHLGLTPERIGLLMGVIMGTKIIAPYLLGWIADKTGQRSHLMHITSVLSVAFFALLYLDHQHMAFLVLIMGLYSFFWNALLPQLETTTLGIVGNDFPRYNRIRLWGSIGFVVLSVAVGLFPQSAAIPWVPTLFIVCLIGIALMSFSVHQPKTCSKQYHSQSIFSLLKRPEIVVFMLICFLMQFSHGTYYTFFSIYLKQSNYPEWSIGALWGWAVVAEVIAFIYMRWFIEHINVYYMLVGSLALTAVRWLMTGYGIESGFILFLAQGIHAFSFGVFHAAGMIVIQKFFTGTLQGRGQALYSSISFGLGGAMGAWLSGYTWESTGASLSFAICALIALIGAMIAWFGLRPFRTQLNES